MHRGLEGRRIAVYARDEEPSLRHSLESAGAVVEQLAGNPSLTDADWHGAKYAALVVAGCLDHGQSDPRLLQLFREFLVADKPVAVFGEGMTLLEQAGATAEDVVVASGADDLAGFTQQLVSKFSDQTDERQADEMSEQSFPASDPPSTTPISVGRPKPDREGDARA